MPAHKDFKRLVRARMTKTGESYTTARAHLLRKKPLAVAAPAAPSPTEFARLAGMSDATIKAKTGCTWERWVRALDRLGAADLPHRAIAELVHRTYKVPDWWAQTVTVGYERIKGLREIGQRRDGGYEASKSRTFSVPIATLYRAFSDKRARGRWLPETDVTVRTATRNKSARWTWPDGTLVQLYFTPRGKGKSQVAVQHGKLTGKEAVAERKAFWADRLGALAETLVTSGRASKTPARVS
jgi:uncharacterized protein YndB with AHSA1/START domain